MIAFAAGQCHPASAHAFLASASPAVGSTIAAAPAEIVIHFTEGVEPDFSTIAVMDAAGHEVDTGTVHLQATDADLAIAVLPIGAGSYTVHWHATAVDTHKTEGSFSFTIAPRPAGR